MDVFGQCHRVNDLLIEGNDSFARDELIQLLDQLRQGGVAYTPLVNRLIRDVGLFPYIDPESSSWEEKYVFEAFKSDVGEAEPVTLHREQSRLLNKLLAGESIAVSAPTSFGKSFVIDSFISLREPNTVVIIVPTIALADETRRRLQRKFSAHFKIITTSDQRLAEKNIFVFPQERAIGYIALLNHIDILIVDEFYKAGAAFDKDRSPSLIRAIMSLSEVADQRYFLAPNINELQGGPFTEGMEFLRLDFHTVFLEKNDLYPEIGNDAEKKNAALLGILGANHGKTLIYAGTYANVERISNLLTASLSTPERELLTQFRAWLAKNYDPNWSLTNLVAKGVGVHNGRLHRSLSQIQVRLFEEDQGIDRIISTSSIIEGVNTSAEIVILWSNKNGNVRINDFTYKNIIGRGGRMFRHFVGKIFILEEPPAETNVQLELEMPEDLLGTFDETAFEIELSRDQVAAIESYRAEMTGLIGNENYEYFQAADVLQSSSSDLILRIARETRTNHNSWNGLLYLNSPDTENWDRLLYKLIDFHRGSWGVRYRDYVAFVKVLSENWIKSIPEMLAELNRHDISIDQFFELERHTTFRLASLLGDVQTIYNRIYPESAVDLAPAISKFSHAFLPTAVYQLEEYGLPRMISRKLHVAGLIDFEDADLTVHDAIEKLGAIGIDHLRKGVGDLDGFDFYILHYFFEGIATSG